MPKGIYDRHSKNAPAIAPGEDDTDNGAAAKQTVRLVQAGTQPPPQTTAPASIFAAADAAKPATKKRAPRQLLDVAAVEIKLGVPLPAVHSVRTAIYPGLWQRIPVGGMVELPNRQAHGLYQHCNKIGAKSAIRTLSPTTKGLWRLG
jgi:hypothetical protein